MEIKALSKVLIHNSKYIPRCIWAFACFRLREFMFHREKNIRLVGNNQKSKLLISCRYDLHFHWNKKRIDQNKENYSCMPHPKEGLSSDNFLCFMYFNFFILSPNHYWRVCWRSRVTRAGKYFDIRIHSLYSWIFAQLSEKDDRNIHKCLRFYSRHILSGYFSSFIMPVYAFSVTHWNATLKKINSIYGLEKRFLLLRF